jgi:hypothetical protein
MERATNPLSRNITMTKPARPTTPSDPREESQVQSRSPSEQSPPARPRFSSAPGDLTPHERLERKLGIGRDLLGKMKASDGRARLLSVAIMRRDEALLDGVLAELQRETL